MKATCAPPDKSQAAPSELIRGHATVVEFRAQCCWLVESDVLSESMVAIIAPALSGLLTAGASLAATPRDGDQISPPADARLLHVECRLADWTIDWGSRQLRTALVLRLIPARESDEPLEAADALHASAGAATLSAAELEACLAAAAGLLQPIDLPLTFQSCLVEPRKPLGGATASSPRLEAADLARARQTTVPVEFDLLLSKLQAVRGQQITLSDVLEIARSEQLDDETLLAAVNHYLQQGDLVLDRQRLTLRLSDQGRAARAG
jgi:hypothetical protein